MNNFLVFNAKLKFDGHFFGETKSDRIQKLNKIRVARQILTENFFNLSFTA